MEQRQGLELRRQAYDEEPDEADIEPSSVLGDAPANDKDSEDA